MSEITYAYIGGLTKSRDARGFLTVKGLATDDTLDLDNQICDPEWLKTAMPEWFKTGNIREQHTMSAVGKATEMSSKGSGFEIAAKVVDPVAALKVEEDVYTGFSIGIKGAYVDYDDPRAPNGVIKGGRVVEVSLVDLPANPSCTLELAKSVGGVLTKADGVDEVGNQPGGEMNCPKCMATGKVLDHNAEIECPECKGTGTLGEGVADEKPYEGQEQHDAPKSVEGDVEKRDYSDKEREALAEEGHALPDGSYPIKTVADLKNAIQAYGRAKDKAKVRAHITARAKDLGREDLIPETFKSVEGELVKADEMEHDPAELNAVRAGLVNLIKAELDEMLKGEEDEIADVRHLLMALDLFLCWWDKEADENETAEPFAEGEESESESDDTMTYIGLGVSADLIKSATAPEATDDTKTELRAEIRKALGVDAEIATYKALLQEQDEAIKSLSVALEDVKKMAAPGGPVLRATNVQQARSAEADELEAKAAKYQFIANTSSEKGVAAQYIAAAEDLLKQAKVLRTQSI